MLSLRSRFGIPGVISVIALVFAMLGGAYAAQSSSGGKATASAKAKKGPRGPKGATGPAGPAGPAGPQGAKGDAGANGANGAPGAPGANGANGKTILSGTASPTGAVGTDGDFYIETDVSKIYGPKAAGSWPAGVELKGKEGSPWTEFGVLPSGQTETGTLSFSTPGPIAFEEQQSFVAPISFAIPVEPAPTLVYVGIGEDKSAEGCPGRSAEGTPMAEEGTLCIYRIGGIQSTLEPGGAFVSPAGASLPFNCKGIFEEFELPCRELAVWAVTAE